MKVQVLIVGAGPTGLGAAYHLNQLGNDDWMLVEAEDVAGGLAASFVDQNGFTWDIGGHVQFSHYEYFDKAMNVFLGDDGWFHHQRESWVWMRDRFIPYPLQNNIHRLPPEDLNKCLQGLLEIREKTPTKPKNFQEWIQAGFGTGIAEVFLEPYNFKVWAHKPETMNAHWVGERVANVDLRRVLRNIALGSDDVSWGPNATFRFPKKGGTGSIWRACAARLPESQVHLGRRIVEIDLAKHTCRTGDGEIITYETLISTIPLRELVRISGLHQFDAPVNRGLLYSASNIIGLGLRGQPPESLASKCWMYFPEDNCPFYRVTVFSNYSPANVPDSSRHWSLMFEISESEHKAVNQASLIEETIQGALNTHLISKRSEVISTWSFRAPFGYPTPGLLRDDALRQIIPFFERNDVFSRGRFGMWKYEVSNQDHSFMQGVEVAERLVNKRQELTAFDSEYVNAKKHPWPFEVWA